MHELPHRPINFDLLGDLQQPRPLHVRAFKVNGLWVVNLCVATPFRNGPQRCGQAVVDLGNLPVQEEPKAALDYGDGWIAARAEPIGLQIVDFADVTPPPPAPPQFDMALGRAVLARQ